MTSSKCMCEHTRKSPHQFRAARRFSLSLSHETIVLSSWQSLRIQEKNRSEILYENSQRIDAHEGISKSPTVSASCFIQQVNSRIFFSFPLCIRVHGEELARIRLLLCCWMNIALQQLHMFTRRPTLLPLLHLHLCVRVIPVRRSSAFVAINDLFALKICKFLEVFGVSKNRLTSWSDRLSLSRCELDWVFLKFIFFPFSRKRTSIKTVCRNLVWMRSNRYYW